ncbi:MAG: hypothetical protein RJA49_2058 [Actinomycetota bacterium]
MSMDPPKVLLEASFLRAVADADDTHHDACTTLYADLVAQYERQEILLVAVGDHLRAADLGADLTNAQRAGWFLHRPRKGVFAPVDPLYVGFQHRRAAAATADVPDPAVAMTLVMCSRHKVRRLATVDPAYDAYDLERLPPTTA